MASNSYEDTLKEKLSDLQESLQILSEARTKNTPAEELLAMIYDVSRCHFEVAEILSSNHNELEAVSHLISAMYYIKATLNPRSAGLLFRQLSDALAPEPARAFIYEQKHGKYLIAGRTFNTLGEAITHARSACPWKAIKFEPLPEPKEVNDGQKDGKETKTGQAANTAPTPAFAKPCHPDSNGRGSSFGSQVGAAARRAEARGPVKA